MPSPRKTLQTSPQKDFPSKPTEDTAGTSDGMVGKMGSGNGGVVGFPKRGFSVRIWFTRGKEGKERKGGGGGVAEDLDALENPDEVKGCRSAKGASRATMGHHGPPRSTVVHLSNAKLKRAGK